MKTWQKVTTGCSGLGCAGFIGLFVIAALSGSLSEYEKLGREHREQQEHQAGAVKPSVEATGSTSSIEESSQPTKPTEAVEQAKPAPPPFVLEENGEPVTLSRYVFRAHFGNKDDPESQKGQVFPERDGVVGWVASRNIEGDGQRYTIYEYRTDNPHVEFAVELQSGASLILPGRSPQPGCYRYLGILEGKSAMGNPVPVMLFRREPFDHPLCASS
jgi:hypothetical protein